MTSTPRNYYIKHESLYQKNVASTLSPSQLRSSYPLYLVPLNSFFFTNYFIEKSKCEMVVIYDKWCQKRISFVYLNKLTWKDLSFNISLF